MRACKVFSLVPIALAALVLWFGYAPVVVHAQEIAVPYGGATPYHLPGGTAATTNSTNIKPSMGTLYTAVAVNTTGTIYFLRLYDLPGPPNCASAVGAVHSYPIPANTNGAGFVIPIPQAGEAYLTGLSYCITGGGADNDNTNAAPGVFFNATYK